MLVCVFLTKGSFTCPIVEPLTFVEGARKAASSGRIPGKSASRTNLARVGELIDGGINGSAYGDVPQFHRSGVDVLADLVWATDRACNDVA